MQTEYERLKECYQACRNITDFQPKLGLVLGSGLGALADEIQCEAVIPYDEIPGDLLLQDIREDSYSDIWSRCRL